MDFLISYKSILTSIDYISQEVYIQVVSYVQEFGTIKIHLNELIEKKGISKNKLGQRAEMERTQLNRYCKNTVTRLDIDVLARLCTALECDIGDLLEFIPPEEK